MPKSKEAWAKKDLIPHYIERPVSYVITSVLLETNVTANFVSFVSLLFCVGSSLLIIYLQSFPVKIISWAFLFLWSIADCVDGNIARIKKTTGVSGELWDAVAGYTAMSCLFINSGILAYQDAAPLIKFPIEPAYYILLGSLSAVVSLLPRVLIHKKTTLTQSRETAANFKDRTSFSFSNIVVTNVMSITGVALFALLFSILLRMENIYVIFYFSVNLLICIYSLYITVNN